MTNRRGLEAVADEPRPAADEVDAERASGLAADGHDPLLVALAAGAQLAAVEVEVGELEVDRLRRPQAAGVHHLEQRAVAQRGRLGAVGLGEQPGDLVAREHLGQLAALARRLELRGRVVLDQALAAEMAVEGAQARDLALQRRGLGGRLALAPVGELGDELGEPGVVEAQRVAPGPAQPVAELQQVGAVGLERVAREPALELEVGEEVEHEVVVGLGAGRSGDERHVRRPWPRAVVRRAAAPLCSTLRRRQRRSQRRRRSSSSPISVFASRTCVDQRVELGQRAASRSRCARRSSVSASASRQPGGEEDVDSSSVKPAEV